MTEEFRSLESLLTELLEWYKAVNHSVVRRNLMETLTDSQRRVAYELTTPDRSSAEVSKLIASLDLGTVARRTVSGWQAEWVRLGLVRQISPKKRERIFSLTDFGIDIGVDLSKVTA